ncbi:LuxR C-terminal-related transcriptional regulator [Streptomyces sp. NPDC057740]|uniref:LuxR C-terminal-related transcriptional regulator n=1 Tax=Streptomyces sp. NPDC057740 TaxID=3346234 RepID=UPI0036BC0D8C
MGKSDDVYGLSPRECTILDLLSAGRTVAETAEHLSVSEKTAQPFTRVQLQLEGRRPRL